MIMQEACPCRHTKRLSVREGLPVP
jgi:hypothetical protein